MCTAVLRRAMLKWTWTVLFVLRCALACLAVLCGHCCVRGCTAVLARIMAGLLTARLCVVCCFACSTVQCVPAPMCFGAVVVVHCWGHGQRCATVLAVYGELLRVCAWLCTVVLTCVAIVHVCCSLCFARIVREEHRRTKQQNQKKRRRKKGVPTKGGGSQEAEVVAKRGSNRLMTKRTTMLHCAVYHHVLPCHVLYCTEPPPNALTICTAPPSPCLRHAIMWCTAPNRPTMR